MNSEQFCTAECSVVNSIEQKGTEEGQHREIFRFDHGQTDRQTDGWRHGETSALAEQLIFKVPLI